MRLLSLLVLMTLALQLRIRTIRLHVLQYFTMLSLKLEPDLQWFSKIFVCMQSLWLRNDQISLGSSHETGCSILLNSSSLRPNRIIAQMRESSFNRTMPGHFIERRDQRLFFFFSLCKNGYRRELKENHFHHWCVKPSMALESLGGPTCWNNPFSARRKDDLNPCDGRLSVGKQTPYMEPTPQ